jgi:DNA-binding CsgD family transcriptional regulator
MVLADARRRVIDINPAAVKVLGRGRRALLGRHVWEFVQGGPLIPEDRWREVMMGDQFVGQATILAAGGERVLVEWAGHPETVTGRRLVLFVALRTSRWGRHFRREVNGDEVGGELSDRERQIVQLVALGQSGPEIAEQLHISHNTVRTHLRNAMVKVGARSRAQLVAKALGDGHVPG